MNWYKKFKSAGKTYRDMNTVILYHSSPERLLKLLPLSRSHNRDAIGMYLAPSYKRAIDTWASWVMGKKRHTDLSEKRKQIVEEIDALSEERYSKKAKNPEDQLKIDALNEKLEKILDAMQRESYQEGVKPYKYVYIHKVSCPKDIFLECHKRFGEFYDEVFIPSEHLRSLEIISTKKVTMDEIMEGYRNMNAGWGMARQQSLKLTPEQEKKFEEEEQKRKMDLMSKGNPNELV